jgi:cyanate permease
VAWRDLFNYIGFLGIALFILGALFIRNPSPIPARSEEGVGGFFSSLGSSILEVGKIPHVWVASVFGALCFGVMLGLGVIWAPKLLMVRGFDQATANWSASLLWLGLAAGCFTVPSWSDALKRRKLPILIGTTVQTVALALLIFLPHMGLLVAMILCFAFGVGNAAHACIQHSGGCGES